MFPFISSVQRIKWVFSKVVQFMVCLKVLVADLYLEWLNRPVTFLCAHMCEATARHTRRVSMILLIITAT